MNNCFMCGPTKRKTPRTEIGHRVCEPCRKKYCIKLSGHYALKRLVKL